MAVNIHNLIAAINPELYCDPEVKSEVIQLAKKEGFLAAAEEAKPKQAEFFDFIDISYKNAADKPGLEAPIEKHLLVYDSFGESLEPIYFWILDKMQEEFKKVDKLTDNFVSSPGSTHFSELGQKATKMQEEAMKLMVAANTVIKSILNIIYDLKEFKMRLSLYEKRHSEKKEESEAAILSLKQVWMDTVDIKRGNSSIKALALSQQGGFVTLIDAFMAIENEKMEFQGAELDLNERVKRLLKQRISEFYLWLKESEQELRKRFEIEKIYLKSQVNSLKLYARWVKPYLKAARQLEQKGKSGPALVTVFNTALFELSLLGESKYEPLDDIMKGELPKSFKDVKARTYNPVLIVELIFRSAPERNQQGYGFRGRTEIVFTSYALHDDELSILRKEIEKDDMGDVFSLMEGATTESLDQLKLDLDEFIGPDKEKDKKEKRENDSNPFSALFSIFSSGENKNSKDKKKESNLGKDSYVEQILRSQALIEARKKCYRVYDLYKKTHKMPSLPGYT